MGLGFLCSRTIRPSPVRVPQGKLICALPFTALHALYRHEPQSAPRGERIYCTAFSSQARLADTNLSAPRTLFQHEPVRAPYALYGTENAFRVSKYFCPRLSFAGLCRTKALHTARMFRLPRYLLRGRAAASESARRGHRLPQRRKADLIR